MLDLLRVWTENPVALCIGLVLGLVSLVLGQSMSFWRSRLDVAGKVCRPSDRKIAVKPHEEVALWELTDSIAMSLADPLGSGVLSRLS